MATFKAGEENNYGGSGGTGFFSISNDKETKQVRFMYNTIDDVEGMSVHRVVVGDRERYVNCLRAYNEPVDNCPLCASKRFPTQARVFIPIYNIDEDQVQLWDRGKTMFQKLSSLCARYASNGKHLVNNVFEIERNGKPRDQKTTYEVYYVESDNTELEDLPEMKAASGRTKALVLDKTFEEMEAYLNTGEFPEVSEDGSIVEDVPVRRRGVERRTPATTTRSRGDAF